MGSTKIDDVRIPTDLKDALLAHTQRQIDLLSTSPRSDHDELQKALGARRLATKVASIWKEQNDVS